MTKPFVLFDLGETLVDLKELLVSLAANLASKYPALGPELPTIVRQWISDASRAMPRSPGQAFVPEFEVASSVMAKLLRDRGIRLSDKEAGFILREGWEDFETRVRFVSGVSEEWLKEVRSLSAGLAIVTSEDVKSYKPNPPIYQAALLSLKAQADRSMFVSDSAQDLRGASSLGMATCLFGNPTIDASRELPEGALQVADPRQLPAILRQFAATQ